MDRKAWRQNLWAVCGKGRWHLVALAWIVVVTRCHSETSIQDRNVLAMAGVIQILSQPALALGQAPEAQLDPTVFSAKLGQPEAATQKPDETKTKLSPLGTIGVTNIFSASVREQIITLDGALRLAGFENPTIGLAEERIRSNLAEQTLARSLLFPSLNVGTTLSLHQGNLLSAAGIVRNVDRESLYLGAGADVRGAGTVAIPGIVLSSHLGDAFFAPRVARQKVLSSTFDAQATRNNVLLQVANAYLALVGAEARLLTLRQSAGDLGEVVKLTADFAAKGQGREGDAQRAESEALLLQAKILAAAEEVTFWDAELARLLSLDPSTRLRPEPGTPPLLQLVDTRLPLETLIYQALAQRPEIAARSADVALYETRLRQERIRPLVPMLVVGLSAGDFGGGSDQVGYRFNHFNSRTDVEVLAVWSVQNLGFGNRAIQNKVRAEIGQAEAERAHIIDLVRREVAEAVAQTIALRRQMEIAQHRVATAQKAFRQDLMRTSNLLGRPIEVLDSMNLLTSARQDLVATMVGFSQTQFNLYVAIGNAPAATRSDLIEPRALGNTIKSN